MASASSVGPISKSLKLSHLTKSFCVGKHHVPTPTSGFRTYHFAPSAYAIYFFLLFLWRQRVGNILFLLLVMYVDRLNGTLVMIKNYTGYTRSTQGGATKTYKSRSRFLHSTLRPVNCQFRSRESLEQVIFLATGHLAVLPINQHCLIP
jgi:hypothetical protein